MNTAELIFREAMELPESDAQEVLDFVEFLKAKRAQGSIQKEFPEAQSKTVTLEEHLAMVERMKALRATQPMTHTTVEDMRLESEL